MDNVYLSEKEKLFIIFAIQSKMKENLSISRNTNYQELLDKMTALSSLAGKVVDVG